MLDVVPNQIVQCFTLYHDTVCAVLDKDNSRLLQTVVVGGHGVRRIPAEALSPASREVMLPLKESMAITTFMYTLLLIFDGCITMVCSTVKVIAMCKYAYNKFYSIFLRHLSV